MARMRPYLIFGLGFLAGALLIGGIVIYLIFKDLGENLTAGMNDAMGVHYGVIGAKEVAQEIHVLRDLNSLAFRGLSAGDDLGIHATEMNWAIERDSDEIPLRITASNGTNIYLEVSNYRIDQIRSDPSLDNAVILLDSVDSLEDLNNMRTQLDETRDAYRDLLLSKLHWESYDDVLQFLNNHNFQTTQSVGPHNRVIYRYITIHAPDPYGIRFAFKFDKLVWIGESCFPEGTPLEECWSQN